MNVESFLQGPGPTPEPEQWYSTKTVLLKVNNKNHGLAACGGLFHALLSETDSYC